MKSVRFVVNDISMIFQEPMTSLNPVFTVGNQIMENILLHEDVKKGRGTRTRCQSFWTWLEFPARKRLWTTTRISFPVVCVSVL